MKTIKTTFILLIMAQLTFAQSKKTLQWIGGPTMVLHLGSFKILTDPMLSPKGDSAFIIAVHPTTGEKNAAIKRIIAPADFDRTGIDVLLISHPHADHVDKEAREQLSKALQVIGPAINKEQITGWGFTNFTGLNWADTTVMTKGNETLTIIAAEAHHAAYDPLKTQLGKGNGYIIEYRHGNELYRIYWTGDTVWFDGMTTLTRYGKIDLLVPDMGSVGSDGSIGRRGLNATDCLHIARVIDARNIIPVHHSTFSMYVEPISVLKDVLDQTPFKNRLDILKTGETAKL
jgi:L-ascorbate metabolism protein UlaG (beta-lactamase superfamily)